MYKSIKYTAIFATVAVASYFIYLMFTSESQIEQHDRVAKAACQRNLRTIYSAIESYASSNGVVPAAFDELIEGGFLRLPEPSRGATNPLMCQVLRGKQAIFPRRPKIGFVMCASIATSATASSVLKVGRFISWLTM